MTAAVVLNGRRHGLLTGHLWVWRNEIDHVEGDPAPGDVVAVRDARGRQLASGYWNPASQITVRVLTRGEQAWSTDLLRERLAAAIAHRQHALPDAWTCRRLVHSEADLLPGLIVDQYGNRVVFQLTTLGMDRQRAAIIAALRDRLNPRQLIERSDVPVRALEGLESVSGVVHGDADAQTEITVGAARFAIDLRDPHKTGFYLDQQANYGAVARYVVRGGSVLDVCCHRGGFAIHAGLAGASSVLGIDTAVESVNGASAAAALNGVGDRVRFQRGDAFAELNRLQGERAQFDTIILDPPAFAPTRDAVAGALRGYRELHRRALRLLPVGGVLATFTCSHHIDRTAFLGNLQDAAAALGITLRRESELGASPDHPVLPAVPETEYLYGVIVRVVDRSD